MHRVSTRARRGAVVLALLTLLATSASYADPAPDPEARIGPPIGAAAQEVESPSALDVFWAWLMARIGPPIG